MNFPITLKQIFPVAFPFRSPMLGALRPRASTATCIRVERHQFPRIDIRPGTRVECLEGVVWITYDREPREAVLSVGECYVVDRNARMMVTALESAVVVFGR